MFSWVDFRRDGKHRKEKVDFPLFGKRGKLGRVKNLEENFLSRAHKFFPPKLGGKLMREKCLIVLLP